MTTGELICICVGHFLIYSSLRLVVAHVTRMKGGTQKGFETHEEALGQWEEALELGAVEILE